MATKKRATTKARADPRDDLWADKQKDPPPEIAAQAERSMKQVAQALARAQDAAARGHEDGTRRAMDEYKDALEVVRSTIPLQDAAMKNSVREEQASISREKRRPINAENARKKRKDVTKEALLAFRQEFERIHAHDHGWKSAACSKFGISRDTLKARLEG
jgi:hypothetical protein